jgi:anaerobic selenocysteine-containing dehydrogenase
MRRTGPKGSGKFTRISWDEALVSIAAKLGDVIAKHGAEAIWPYAGSGNMGLMHTVDDRDSDMGWGAVYHDNRVDVERHPDRNSGDAAFWHASRAV